jgi:small-conductance mechanosensitive channel
MNTRQLVEEAVSSVLGSSRDHRAQQGSRTLFEAIIRQRGIFEDGLFDNIAAYGWALFFFVLSWFAALAVSWLLWSALMFNWRRLLGLKQPAPQRGSAAWTKKYNDHDESANKDEVLPMPATVIKARGPQLVGRTVATEPVSFKNVPVVKATDSNRWHGHDRSRYESYVRLVVLATRILIVVAGVLLAFQAAGVNVLSLAASLGVISICFTYGAAPILVNIWAALNMHGTDKIEMGDYIRVGGGYIGLMTAMRTQWSDITDDLNPWAGRQVHQVPNRIFLDSVVTVYPDGPPPEVIKKYFEDLNAVNTWRATSMNLPPIAPIEFKIT